MLDDQVGNDIVGVVGLERRTGPEIEPAQVLERLLDLLDRDPGLLLDGRQPVVLEVVEVLRDQGAEHVVAGRLRRELQQQAFPQVAGADARRVEPLDQPERFLGLFRSSPDRSKSRTTSWKVSLKIALLVEVVNDVLGQLADGRFAVEEAELIGQVVVERAGPRGHVLHGVLFAVGLLAEGRPAPPRPFVVKLAPVLVETDQAVEFVGLAVRLRLGRPRAAVSSPSASVGEADSRRSSRTGFSLSSCSIRSCNAMIGNCKISIDWIMRGAMRRRISVRICWEVSSRMIL